jgi:UDP-glucose 4-epimerase
VTALRLATVLGPHVPSPLGRLLRLPVVPVDLRGLFANARFDVIDDRDAALMAVAAVASGPDGALNVAAADPYPVRTILRHPRRLAVPFVGPQWCGAGAAANLAGAPVPPHVRELLTFGRTVDASAATELLGVTPVWSTPQVIETLFDWAQVVHVKPGGLSDFVAVEGS